MSAARVPGAGRPSVDKHPARIGAMFDAIAARYDFLNHLLSAGLDRRWRARAVAALGLTGRETVLDVCTGTGDVVLAALGARPPAARVVGVDFAAAMLAQAQSKFRGARRGGPAALVRGDAVRLPVVSGRVDAATIAFGVRNVADLAAALAELHRVLRPGGRLAILEFGLPARPGLRRVYLWYLRYVLPRVGGLVSGHRDAYGYLPASVGQFPAGAAFAVLLERAGFVRVTAGRLTLGVVYLYTGEKATKNEQ